MVASPKDINPNNEPTILCPECGVPIPVSMERCPYCGIRMPRGCKMLAIRVAVGSFRKNIYQAGKLRHRKKTHQLR